MRMALPPNTVSVLMFVIGALSGCGGSAFPDCAASTVECSDSKCHDLRNDPSNCGACGKTCAAGEVCGSGVCAARCTGGTSACNGSCVDIATDVNNCGACGNVCSNANGVCVGGSCAVAPCAAGSFLNGNSCQACSSACGAGQFQTAGCSAAADRTCESCTAIPNCTAQTCTTSSNQICTACSAGFYLSGDHCVACATSACPSGQYETAACSATADRTCGSCTAIPNCAAETCTTSADQVCSACGSGSYLSGNACVACSTSACPSGQYETVACSAIADRVCGACTAITNCTAETCTTSSDQVCSACSSGSYLSGNACVACSTTACPSGQYQTAACSAVADRVCGACTAITNCTAETCTTSSDQVCSACSSGKYPSGNSCLACSGACPSGEVQTTACSSTADRTCGPATDCYALHVASPLLTDGSYTLDPDGSGGADPFQAYCDMTTNGGGWTLLMKVDGKQTTFTYSSAYWTNNISYQPTQYAYDTVNETKLSGFNNMPLNAMRVGMYDPTDGNTRWLEVPRVNSSLGELFTSGYQATSFGRLAWEGLMSSPSLQPNCNQEGFNTTSNDVHVRIGILSNQENDCNTPDSRIGIGTNGSNCGQNNNTSSGNEAYCGGDHGDRSKPAFGYVMVRDCPGGVCDCGGLTSCNAVCVDIQSNVKSCGSCTNSCGSQNAAGTCTNGTCTEVCDTGFGNCDNNPSTGCETNLNNDVANCGACGAACGEHQTCDWGVCADIQPLTIINPNGRTVEYLPRNIGNWSDTPEGTCTTDCVVYPKVGNMGNHIRLRAPNGFASGCGQINSMGQCYVSTPATIVVN
ncbi:MAG: Tryptophan synthase alpha chain [Myxococcales bacterium]|nr:Tryptophan synthase alpha chain [Myxococcales bacterium]